MELDESYSIIADFLGDRQARIKVSDNLLGELIELWYVRTCGKIEKMTFSSWACSQSRIQLAFSHNKVITELSLRKIMPRWKN